MKINKYTLVIDYNNETILYNLITKMNLKISVPKKNILEYINELNEEEKQFLKEGLIISENEEDDFKKFLEIKNNYNKSSLKGTFMIHTNYDCNLMCSYCYQSCIENKKVLDDLSEQKIISFVNKTIFKENYKYLDICFIGGEPFLHYKKMINIIKNLNLKNKYYNVSVVTNGTIYSKKIFEELLKYEIKDLQITIDGEKKIHDNLRMYKNTKGSYDVIIENLKKIQINYPDINISINCNINILNKDTIENFLISLKKEKINYPVHFSLVFDNSKNDKYSVENKDIWLKIHKLAYKYGYKFSPFYREMYLGCALTQKNYHIVGADSKLYKCINGVENHNYFLDDIENFGKKEYYNKLEKFLNYFPKPKICKECELLPICYGGCPYKNELNGFKCEKELFYKNDVELIKEIYNYD